jgi:hypothetical protein
VLINDDVANLFDFVSYESYVPQNSSSYAFSNVSSGDAITGEEQESYIVGPTRSTLPSSQVVLFDPDLNIKKITLSAERTSAAATWLKSTGLAIVGGSNSASAVEIVAPLGASTRQLSYPSLDSHGAGAAGFSNGKILVAGGEDSAGQLLDARVFDATCTSTCVAQVYADSATKIGLSKAKGYVISNSEAIFVGESDALQQTRAVWLSMGSDLKVQELPLKQPRRYAGSIQLPNGMVAIVGGLDSDGKGVGSVELLVPKADAL